MVPVKIEGRDARGMLSDIVKDREVPILDPFQTEVKDLSRNIMALEEVGQCQKSHGKEIDPQELTDRPVVIAPFGDVKEEAIHFFHRGKL